MQELIKKTSSTFGIAILSASSLISGCNSASQNESSKPDLGVSVLTSDDVNTDSLPNATFPTTSIVVELTSWNEEVKKHEHSIRQLCELYGYSSTQTDIFLKGITPNTDTALVHRSLASQAHAFINFIASNNGQTNVVSTLTLQSAQSTDTEQLLRALSEFMGQQKSNDVRLIGDNAEKSIEHLDILLNMLKKKLSLLEYEIVSPSGFDLVNYNQQDSYGKRVILANSLKAGEIKLADSYWEGMTKNGYFTPIMQLNIALYEADYRPRGEFTELDKNLPLNIELNRQVSRLIACAAEEFQLNLVESKGRLKVNIGNNIDLLQEIIKGTYRISDSSAL